MENILVDFLSKYITLTEEEKNALIELNTFQSVKKGTILLEEGQRSNTIFESSES